MADQTIGNQHGVAAVSIGGVNNKTNLSGNTGTNPQTGFEMDNADTITALRTRLQAISATTYSDAQLDKMTYNDLIYALRVNDFPTSIKQ